MSRQVDYALQLIVALSKRDAEQVLSLKSFAEESTISFLFLQKIARSLRDAKIICATQGKHGGYALRSSPSKISIKQVIDAVDGTSGISQCTRGQHCKKEGACILEKGIRKLDVQMSTYLSKTTIADIS